MTSHDRRSWWHMIEQGSTMTTEAWGREFKPNLTWNHAWGSAPANVISRFVLGVRPLEPGYAKLIVAPQPGALAWVRGAVPTPHGPVAVSWTRGSGALDVVVPPGTTARVVLPMAPLVADASSITVNGKVTPTVTQGGRRVIERLEAGSYAIRVGGDGAR
jgi:hypothetical protein